MAFESWQAAWQMAGHGPYVWGAYGLTGVVLIALVWMPIARARTVSRQILAEQRRTQSARPASVTSEVSDAS
jgi:heme exporter protein D